MPMPTKDERWVLTDVSLWKYLMTAVSGLHRSHIYLGSLVLSKGHPDLFLFVQVNLPLSMTVRFWHGEGRYYDVNTVMVLGLPKNVHRTLALGVAGLVQLLTIPRQLCTDNSYNLEFLKFQQAISLQPAQPISKSYSDSPDLNWIHVTNGGFGLELVWQPTQKYTWTEQLIKNSFTVATGFIPGVGLTVQLMFSIRWTLISQENPQAAFAVLNELAPGVDLQKKIIIGLKIAASEAIASLTDGWKELNLQMQQKPVEAAMASKPVEAMNAMLPMILQKEVLDATGNSPDKEQPRGSEDEGETLVENVVGDIVEAGDSVTDLVKSAILGL
ncbi:MAG: hypothetical protein Q9215_004105 [Flavoplaca cf. flavocitrina]